MYLVQLEINFSLAELQKWCNESATNRQGHDLLLLGVPPNDGMAHQVFAGLLSSTLQKVTVFKSSKMASSLTVTQGTYSSENPSIVTVLDWYGDSVNLSGVILNCGISMRGE